jgi:hypothetical protein
LSRQLNLTFTSCWAYAGMDVKPTAAPSIEVAATSAHFVFNM